MRAVLGPQHPDQQDRDERGRQRVGGDHRKAHCQRQRDEEIVRRALHEKGCNEDGKDAEHREEIGNKGLGRPVIRGLRKSTPRPRCEWTFSMTTVASSTRIPTASARPPRVIRLTVCPVAHSAIIAARWTKDIHHHDEGASPVAQEQQDHQPRECGAEQAFLSQAQDGAYDERRLIKFVADLHTGR